MKKIFITLLAAVALTACSNKEEHSYTLEYKVYYPNNPVEHTYTMKSNKEVVYWLGSYKGSNTLSITEHTMFGEYVKLEQTTAPIEVVSFTKK